MTTWDDVARVCLALPGTTEAGGRDGARQWRVADKLFVWERPLRPSDLAELGAYFTTAHFDGYPAVLCRLDRLDGTALEEPATEAWACRAPKRLLAEPPGTR